MNPGSVPGIPSSLPILKPGDPVPGPGPWAQYIARLPWSVVKEGDLVKSVFVKFLILQVKIREPVVRPTMGLQPERWNEDLGSNVHNVEAVFVQMVRLETAVRYDHCLAGRGIFPLCVVVDEPGFPKSCGNCMYGGKGGKCTILHHGQSQPVSVPNAGVYGGMVTTVSSSASATHLRAEMMAGLDSLATKLHQLSILQERQAAAIADHESAAESASTALQDVQSRADQTLPVRRNDVVRIRNSLQETIHTASRVKSTTDAVTFKSNSIKEDVEDLRSRCA
ncbi:hypothetical protein N7457_000109 [Penicillium paradoxum]|uniref:uncharacterized protein n=1 Tax=Penicillium paradoxum TaxID=176176 RepID=UPI0025487C04|nr:uncharacterized protein N7457_000109 [Penicillium paradoxum]KAJ5793510.1 hypothetical protein N7457_000109 [Penicillium paradoxum]